MGFICTTPTDIPLDPAGTYDLPTWGESGGPFTPPAEEGPGLGAVPLLANTYNYNVQHPSRWLRSTAIGRSIMSDEGLYCTCVVTPNSDANFNIGGGTLDVVLQPTRIVVDVDGDGGVVLEVRAPVGSPETLPPLSDTYVDFKEDGDVDVTSVANGDPEPAVVAGYARIWKLTTDATELTDVDTVDGVPDFPCLGPTIGIQTGIVTNLTAIDLTVPPGGSLTVNDGATATVEILDLDKLAFLDSGPATTRGVVSRFGNMLVTAETGGARQRPISDPRVGHGESVGPFGGVSTAANTSRTVGQAEPVDIVVMGTFTLSQASSAIIEIEAVYGGGSATILSEGIPAAATTQRTFTIPKLWTPQDSFGAVGEQTYTFNLKLGAIAGTVSSSYVRIAVAPGYQT